MFYIFYVIDLVTNTVVFNILNKFSYFFVWLIAVMYEVVVEVGFALLKVSIILFLVNIFVNWVTKKTMDDEENDYPSFSWRSLLT